MKTSTEMSKKVKRWFIYYGDKLYNYNCPQNFTIGYTSESVARGVVNRYYANRAYFYYRIYNKIQYIPKIIKM